MLPLALIVVILGGAGSLLGAFVGSFIVGFLYNFGQALLPDLAYFVLFLPMVLVLVFRPQGLFGRVHDRHERDARTPMLALAVGRRRCSLTAAALDAGDIYYVNVASQILIYALFALGLNMLVGYGGLVSLGHAGLFGIAAYASPPAAKPATATPRRSWRRSSSTLVATAVFARAGAARHRHRLPDDHAGARPDRLGHRLSLDQPDRRRQRHQLRRGRRRSASTSAGADAFYYFALRRVR